jgi:hypothetical protein
MTLRNFTPWLISVILGFLVRCNVAKILSWEGGEGKGPSYLIEKRFFVAVWFCHVYIQIDSNRSVYCNHMNVYYQRPKIEQE